jgi:hypothetical protein
MSNLTAKADNFLARTPRQNPPNDLDSEVLFDRFLVSLKSNGENMSSWGEGEWYKAARKFGIDEEDIPTMMEHVAAWGVDDSQGIKSNPIDMTLDEYEEHMGDGYCVDCGKITRFGDVKMEGQNYPCPVCHASDTVMGMDSALFLGHVVQRIKRPRKQ